ncbi:hypothetical protein J5X84_39970 [Streptosporangiaceae bacterium NEAU-GS5]|nr:hypothetical protein [Streptosporangiaceae bacterium NEAU-GS5]
MTTRRLLAALLAAALLAPLAACGVEPSNAIDAGPAPVISPKASLVTVFLLKSGRLVPVRVSAASHSLDNVMLALFEAGKRREGDLGTALDDVTYNSGELVPFDFNTHVRNDPGNTFGFRLRLSVTGVTPLSRAAMAQMTCTAIWQRHDIWAVEVTQASRSGALTHYPDHDCKTYSDIAG